MLRIKHRTCFNLLLAPGEEWRARARRSFSALAAAPGTAGPIRTNVQTAEA